MASQKKKKLVAAGIALALMAGVTAGGAIFTYNSTIFGNKFVGEAYDNTVPPTDGYLKVTGAPMSATFSGTNAAEKYEETYQVQNLSETEDFKVDINSHVAETNLTQFADQLAVKVTIFDGSAKVVDAGTVGDMNLGSDAFIVKSGESIQVKLEVEIKDLDAYREAGTENGAFATVDWRFDYILDANGGETPPEV